MNGVLSTPVAHKRAGREQQRVARQKWRDDEARLGQDDREEDAVHPRSVGADEFQQMPVEVEEEINHFGRWSLVVSRES